MHIHFIIDAPLSFAFQIVAKLLCSCLCLFDVIIELHAKDEKIVNNFHTGKLKWDSYLTHDLYLYI